MPPISVISPDPGPVVGFTPELTISVGVISGPSIGTRVVSLDAVQVAGLIPLTACDVNECREICEDDYKNPVFGELTARGYTTTQSYENDWNSFLMNCSSYSANPLSFTGIYYLEKYVDGEWVQQAILNSNTYGIYKRLGTIIGHANYSGYQINWGAVLFKFGMGCYRLKFKTAFTTYIYTGAPGTGTQATATFVLSNNACLVGKMVGTLQTMNGSVPALYNLNQTNPSFTQAQNVQYIVNLINASGVPYTATYTNQNLFTITGQSYAVNNGINWNLVLIGPANLPCEYGVSAMMKNGVNQTIVKTAIVKEKCYETPVFDLKKWDCMRAHGTVKFETSLDGTIGDPYVDYLRHDLCKMAWYDSIRLRGFFGFEKSPTYQTNNLKWGSPKIGLIEKVNDEQIQRWEYRSKFLPEYIHSRFATFGMMSDKTFVSDYNINNSNYTIKRKSVMYDSGYEPEYHDKDAFWQVRAKSNVNVFFKRGVQSAIKSLCCS